MEMWGAEMGWAAVEQSAIVRARSQSGHLIVMENERGLTMPVELNEQLVVFDDGGGEMAVKVIDKISGQKRSLTSDELSALGLSTTKNPVLYDFGTYLRPFSADSPWNLRVVDPVFGTYVIPIDQFFPAVQASIYSTEFVHAQASDGPITFYPTLGTPVRDTANNPAINTAYGTASNLASLTLPRMPATFNVAAGTDGHIDIYDEVNGIIHSLWQAKKGCIASIAVTNGGAGYTPNSTTIPVTIVGDGVGAEAKGTTNSSGVLTSITVTSFKNGANYTYANVIIGGTGAGATATATVDTLWRCYQYNWCHISDTGWGDRGRYYKGARAAGVPTCGGIIRRNEIDDGDYMFRHVLAMSMTYSGLSGVNGGFVYPATTADAGFASNTGQIPEGALVMLPKTFNIDGLKNSVLKKICRTLQEYGARVVDRNNGTPFVIYVEGVDSWFNVKEYSSDKYYDSNNVAQSPSIFAELDQIRAALRQVIGVGHYVDGYGNKLAALPDRIRMSNGISGGSFTQNPVANGTTVLSMTAAYDSVTDEVVIGGISGAWTLTHTNPPNNAYSKPSLKPFTTYKMVLRTKDVLTVKPSINVTGGGPRIGVPTLSNTVPIGFFRTGESITNQSVSFAYSGTGTGTFRAKVSLVEVTNDEIGDYYPKWVSTPTISSAVVGVACTPVKNVTGSGTLTWTYQWWLNGANVSIPNGGTNESYTPQAGDVGKALYQTAIATNEYGIQASATTNIVIVAAS